MAVSFGPQMIGETEKTLNAVLRRSLEGSGLTEAQWVTLRLAGQLTGGVDAEGLVAEITRRVHFRDAAAIVEDLTRRGMLDHGRLTPAGQQLVAAVQTAVATVTAPIWEDLPVDDVAAAARVLNDVVARARLALLATPADQSTSTPAALSTGASISRTIWRHGVAAGLAAAAVTTLIVVAAHSADVPVAVSGEKIPLAGFAQFTFVGALLGIGLAKIIAKRTRHQHRTFLRTTGTLTALSIVPDLAVDATIATKLVLACTHLVAAVIIVPIIARRLAK